MFHPLWMRTMPTYRLLRSVRFISRYRPSGVDISPKFNPSRKPFVASTLVTTETVVSITLPTHLLHVQSRIFGTKLLPGFTWKWRNSFIILLFFPSCLQFMTFTFILAGSLTTRAGLLLCSKRTKKYGYCIKQRQNPPALEFLGSFFLYVYRCDRLTCHGLLPYIFC